MTKILDPIKFAKKFWPHVNFYDKQKEIIYSVADNDETVVPAGNKLGKDFVAAYIALWFFLSRDECRVVTTSVDSTQLVVVLWGEMNRFLDETKFPLPILRNHQHLRKIRNGKICPISYVIGKVASQEGEGMSGHHIAAPIGEAADRIPRTLLIVDEASGVNEKSLEKAESWAERKLIIGNPYPCNNYFFKAVERGDVKAPTNGHFYTKVIKIQATDSPNVKYAEKQIEKGKEVTNSIIVPGVQPYSNYIKYLETWDRAKQSIGLFGEFYHGEEIMLYPLEWREHSKKLARELKGDRRSARTMGVDTGEGGDDTCWAIVDEKGLIKLIAVKTPDTSVIPDRTIHLMKEFSLKPENVYFDRGGGGKEHADNLRSKGFDVNTVFFGVGVKDPNRFKKMKTKRDKISVEEERETYKTRRAEMYCGVFRKLMNPVTGGFAIPEEYTELYRQLKVFPLMYDEEGKLTLPPKRTTDPKSKKQSIISMLGCSPDEMDALVLATYGMMTKVSRKIAGVF